MVFWFPNLMSALPLKADMCGAASDVRYGPIADIDQIARSLVGVQYIDGGIVRPSVVAVSAFSAITCCIGKSPSPLSEPERVFTSSQPAITDEIVGIECGCLAATLLGAYR
jgi:hypothetical protein